MSKDSFDAQVDVMHSKIDDILSQMHDMQQFYNSNSDELNAGQNQSKDMKFYWKKKIEQVKSKVDTLRPALQRAVKNY